MTMAFQNATNSDGGESAPPARPSIIEIPPDENSDTKISNKRLKDIEICVPIVYGTISFWLGRKASESQSHKWTVYVRGATNEDLSPVIKRVVFQLHPSFNNPVRVVESVPFELTECGWGEFEMAISILFHGDACDKQLDLFHNLKLYSEEEPGPQSTKKPVVKESYNEIVFPDPYEDFFSHVHSHPSVIVPRLPTTLKLPPVKFPYSPLESVDGKKRGDTKDHPLSQWFIDFSEPDELLKLAGARQQVSIRDFLPSPNQSHAIQAYIGKMRRQLSMMDGLPQSLKPAYGLHMQCSTPLLF